MPYTSADLISAVKRRAFAPTGQNTFPNSDILALADEEMETLVVPELMSVREEYFLTYTDYAVTAGQAAYAVPERSVGMSIREVKLVGPSGGFTDLPQITPESLTSDNAGAPTAFYMRENSIVLWPTPVSTGDTLRVFYCRQQSKLIETSAAAIVSSVVGVTANVNAVPAGWSTADTFDLIKSTGGQEVITQDRSITSLGATSVDFSSALPSSVVSGTYLAKAGETPIVQVPKEYRTILAQAVTVRILKSMRLDGHEEETKVLGAMMESARKLISPRVVGEPQKILSAWR